MARAFLSQKKLAAAAGCSPQQINNILGCRNEPSMELLAKLADVCGFNVDWYLTGRGWPWRFEPDDPDQMRPSEEPASVRIHHVVHYLCGACGCVVTDEDDYCFICGRRLSWPKHTASRAKPKRAPSE